nr:hypothetical protein [Bradyrhizobium sp. 2S1]MCK7667506.1 hypothetical protein [Bradyrhizobium sp. 2S1]
MKQDTQIQTGHSSVGHYLLHFTELLLDGLQVLIRAGVIGVFDQLEYCQSAAAD